MDAFDKAATAKLAADAVAHQAQQMLDANDESVRRVRALRERQAERYSRPFMVGWNGALRVGGATL